MVNETWCAYVSRQGRVEIKTMFALLIYFQRHHQAPDFQTSPTQIQIRRMASVRAFEFEHFLTLCCFVSLEVARNPTYHTTNATE